MTMHVIGLKEGAEALPDELLEARVDGAGELYIFLRIVLPLLAPALVSLGIIVFTWAWGAFLWPLVVVQDRNLYVLSVGLSAYVQPYNRERPGLPRWPPRRSRRCRSPASSSSCSAISSKGEPPRP
jgi:ABC-type glycerol-3-phosphate transport system permease component